MRILGQGDVVHGGQDHIRINVQLLVLGSYPLTHLPHG